MGRVGRTTREALDRQKELVQQRQQPPRRRVGLLKDETDQLPSSDVKPPGELEIMDEKLRKSLDFGKEAGKPGLHTRHLQPVICESLEACKSSEAISREPLQPDRCLQQQQQQQQQQQPCFRAVFDGFAASDELQTLKSAAHHLLEGMFHRGAEVSISLSQSVLDQQGVEVWNSVTQRCRNLLVESLRSLGTDQDFSNLRLVGTVLRRVQWPPLSGPKQMDPAHDTFVAHVDGANVAAYQYSAILYLNDQRMDFEGGDLLFLDGDGVDRAVSPEAGRLVLFSSGFENLHQVQRMTSGERLMLGLWFGYESIGGIHDIGSEGESGKLFGGDADVDSHFQSALASLTKGASPSTFRPEALSTLHGPGEQLSEGLAGRAQLSKVVNESWWTASLAPCLALLALLALLKETISLLRGCCKRRDDGAKEGGC